jgi:hypothetical protein
MTADMAHRHLRAVRLLALGLNFGLVLVPACDKGGLSGPEAEVGKSNVKMNLPPVPNFELPPAPSDGTHSVKEMRVKGKKLLDTEVTVKGYVTWAYDCLTALREPGMEEKDVQKIIDEDPTKCERAKFYVGDAPDTPAQKSLWVVDVPRPYNKLEMERLKKKDRTMPDRCEPDELVKDPKKSICPPYKVGDQITVTGTFKLASPHSERNSEGLLVFKKLHNETQQYDSPPPNPTATGTTPAGTPPPTGGPPAKPSPEDLVNKKKSG